MKSTEFLQSAIDVQAERGKQYDKPTGERSMGATISAFNCITGYTLEESDGWMLLSLLKLVRQAQNPEQYHHDSALDFVAYASLYAEAASEQCGQKEEFDPTTMPIIELKVDGAPSWDDAPEWATHLMVANFEISGFDEYQFAIYCDDGYYDDPNDDASRFLTEDERKFWSVYSSRPKSTNK